MTNYKELIDTLRDLTHGGVRITNGSVMREAATAIETLLSQLTVAQSERNVVTKRIIELEKELAHSDEGLGIYESRIAQLENEKEDMWKELDRVKAERDAMLKGLKDAADCDQCKYEPMAMPCEKEVVEFCEECNLEKIPCCGCSGENWEWRGAKEES